MREGESYFVNTPVETQPHSRKEAELMKKEEEVGRIPNMEAGAIKIIAALNISEIPTSQSCEGDIYENGTGINIPFVEISAPNQPEKRFVGQEKIIKFKK